MMAVMIKPCFALTCLMSLLWFAIITPALIVGGFAERMRFSAMLLFSAVWLLLVYAPICHWVWGGGLSAAVICYFATNWIKNTLRIDDSLDVFPVHGVGGILGTLLAGVFCSTQLGVFCKPGLFLFSVPKPRFASG